MLIMVAATLFFGAGAIVVGRDVVAEWRLSPDEIRRRSTAAVWDMPLKRRLRIASPAGFLLGLTMAIASGLILADDLGLLDVRVPALIACGAVVPAFFLGMSTIAFGRPRFLLLPGFRPPGAFRAAMRGE